MERAMAWFLLASGPGGPAFNMAMDEALLLSMPRLGTPVLRFYSWIEPAASFGYFQKYSEVERMTRLRPLVRRPTGGGLVPHDADWTYSLAVPIAHAWYDLRAAESYQRVHQWIKAAFGLSGITTELAAAPRHHAGPGQCFVGYEKSDILWNGLKIAGAAQRRTGDGLLIQASIQPGPIKLARAEWEKNMASAAPEFLVGPQQTFEPDEPLLDKVAQLNRSKYSADSFHRKR
jgi:lipoate-protein ligase A